MGDETTPGESGAPTGGPTSEATDTAAGSTGDADSVSTGATNGSTDGGTNGDEVAAAEEAVEHDIDTLLAERDQFRDIALRLQADFENFRKRADRQRTDDVDRSTGRLVEDLLPALDACELAYAHGVQGVEGIWSALLSGLRKHGLEPMDSQGKPFDPTQHEAVAHEDGEAADGPVVAEVFRTGYAWKGKVLRAAMVKVRG